MITTAYRLLLAAALLGSGIATASAHLTYANKDFGIFNLTPRSMTIFQNAEGSFGWADGTDADFGFSHDQTYFKFTIQQPVTITVTVQSLNVANFLPAFSIYSGLGQTNPPDYDEYDSEATTAYLASLPGIPKEGAFRALNTWKMGGDNDFSEANLSTFTYVNHAADGTAANYGTAAGIVGDGMADGFVTHQFALTPGDYTLVVGGADYFDQDDLNTYNFNTTVSVVPEPSSACLLLGGLSALGLLRRRS